MSLPPRFPCHCVSQISPLGLFALVDTGAIVIKSKVPATPGEAGVEWRIMGPVSSDEHQSCTFEVEESVGGLDEGNSTSLFLRNMMK